MLSTEKKKKQLKKQKPLECRYVNTKQYIVKQHLAWHCSFLCAHLPFNQKLNYLIHEHSASDFIK
uniref:Uncharacterized protein n=1 Tax=Octopus bimaculoides TaxID=37653 RepID=A0A0L8FFR7_OCTBM